MVEIDFMIDGNEGEKIIKYVKKIGIGMLWIQEIMKIYKGWEYLRDGIKKVMD